jgi:hypothetical protein
MTTLTKDPIKLAKALELARLDPNERFDKENITAIHEGLAPYYKELTGRKLPSGCIVLGYGDQSGLVDDCIVFLGNFEEQVYYCQRPDAEARGWIDPLPKPKFKGTLAECAQWCADNQINRNFRDTHAGWFLKIDDRGWMIFDGSFHISWLSGEWEEVSND